MKTYKKEKVKENKQKDCFEWREWVCVEQILDVRCSSHQRVKVCRVSSGIYRVQKLCTISSVMQICQNDLSFSLYAMLSVYYIVATSDEQMKSRMKMSADVGVLPLNTRNQFQQKLSLLIIRLSIYSITTSLIYKLNIQEIFRILVYYYEWRFLW